MRGVLHLRLFLRNHNKVLRMLKKNVFRVETNWRFSNRELKVAFGVV